LPGGKRERSGTSPVQRLQVHTMRTKRTEANMIATPGALIQGRVQIRKTLKGNKA